jgi:hypothetical protein
MTTVYWNYIFFSGKNWFGLTAVEPTLALQEIVKNRDSKSEAHFSKCPAFIQYYKNTYVLKSPIDIQINYDRSNGQLTIFPQQQRFYDENINHRGHSVGRNDSFLMSFALDFLFIADKDCEIELIPCAMHKSEFTDKTRLINGAFNINKWYRPVELAFELKDTVTQINIKRGDALAYVRFLPKDGGKIKLQYKDFPKETLDVVAACLTTNELINRFSLDERYTLAERIRNKLWFNKKKCPFNWRNK